MISSCCKEMFASLVCSGYGLCNTLQARYKSELNLTCLSMLTRDLRFLFLAFELDHDLNCFKRKRVEKSLTCMFDGSREGQPPCALFNTDEGGGFMLAQ